MRQNLFLEFVRDAIVIKETTNSIKTPAPPTLTLRDLTEEEKEKLNEGILL